MNAPRILTRFGVAVLLTCIAITPAIAQPAPEKRISVSEWLAHRTQPAVIAHRGCHHFGPENSLKGMRACIAMGVEMIEADVRPAKDGTLVLMHDSDMDRMTNMTGAVNRFTYQELSQARLRDGSGGKDAPLTNEIIPTLADCLRTAKGHLFVVLHIKEDADINQVFDVVSAAGAQGDVLFLWDAPPDSAALAHAKFIGRSAFVPIVVQCTLSPNKGCYTDEQFRMGKVLTDYQRFHPLAYLTAAENDLFLQIAETAKWRSAFKVMANGDETHPEEAWTQYAQWNVPMILTDHAKPLVDFLKSKGLR